MIVIRMNGEIEEKLKTIALLKGVDKEHLLEILKEKATETIRSEVEKEYNDIIAQQ